MKKLYLLFFLLFGFVLSACSQKAEERSSQMTTEVTNAEAANQAANNSVAKNEKLGTGWGDEIDSYVTEIDLKRKSNTPLSETLVQYADKAYEGREVKSISIAAGKISFSIVDDHGDKLALYRVGQRYYLRGQQGQSYQLHYENNTGKTFEIVSSVDGIDVIDGSEASRSNSGYVLHPHDELTIEGFRKSENAVASFTFSKPKDSYAANSDNGSIQNTGIIGTVVYELKVPEVEAQSSNKYAPPPNAFPKDRD